MKYLLLVIVCVTVIFVIFRDHIPFGRNNTDFAVKEGTGITRIDLLQGNRKVSIRLSGDEWNVNRAKEARKSAVLLLIRALKEIKIKSPVSPQIFKSEVIDKKIEPVRVIVYHRIKPVRSFYVYKTSSNIYGNIMKMRPSSKPFIVSMPGYEENIGSFFIADELFWLPFSVFRLLPSDILSVKLENHDDSLSSFMVIRNAGGFILSEKGEGGRYDSTRVRRYISYFTSVSFESWAMELTLPERAAIESSPPAYTILVNTVSGEKIEVKIWERIRNSATGEKDTDRVWAEKNDGKGIFIMRYFDLDPILKKKSWFAGG